MKNLGVLLVFVLSLVGVLHTVQAEAYSYVRVEDPDALTAPVLMESMEIDDDNVIANDKKKRKKDKKGEEDEEDYRLADTMRALQLLDPGAVDYVFRATRSPFID